MKRVLLLVTALLFTLGLTACGLFGQDDPDPDPDPTITSITLNTNVNLAETYVVYVDATFNALDLFTATGSDGNDYTDDIVVESDFCTINSSGVVDTSSPITCALTFTVIVEGKFDSATLNVEVKYEGSGEMTIPALWDFSADTQMNDWRKYEGNNGEFPFTMSIDEGALKIELTNIGAPWEPRLDYQGLPLEQGKTYQVTFKAKAADEGKIIRTNFGEILDAAPWYTTFRPSEDNFVTLTTDWETYSYVFEMTLDNQNGGPLFEFGKSDGDETLTTVWLDDITVVEFTGEDGIDPVLTGIFDSIIDLNSTFDETVGVTATDNKDGDITSSITITGTVDTATEGVYELTYTVSDSAGNEVSATRKVEVMDIELDDNNQALMDFFTTGVNLTLDVDADPWFTELNWGEATMDYQFIDGELVLDLQKAYNDNNEELPFAGAMWDNNIKYPALQLIEGITYVIEFQVKTSELDNDNASFIVKVEDGLWGSDNYAALNEMTIQASSEFTTVQVPFEMTNPTSTNATFLFMIGGTEHVLTFKDVKVYISAEGASVVNAPVIQGAENVQLNTGDTFDLSAGVTATDLEDGTVVPVVTVVGPNGETVFDTSIMGSWTVTYTATDSDMNVTTTEIIVSIMDMVFTNVDLIENPSFIGIPFDTLGDSFVLNNGVLELSYTAGGNQWDKGLVQYDVPLVVGKTYRITFEAKGDAARQFTADIYNGVDYRSPDFDLTTEWQTFTYDFVYSDAGWWSAPKLHFEMGGNAVDGILYIDNISLKEVDPADNTQVIGDEYVLFGDFEGAYKWGVHTQDGATGSIGFTDEGLLYTYDGVGNGDWHNKVEQSEIEFVHGMTYKISFMAKGDADRDFMIALWDYIHNWSPGSETFELTTEYTLYEFVFTYTSFNPSRLEIKLGKMNEDNHAGTMFYMKDLAIAQLDGLPLIENGGFDNAAAGYDYQGQAEIVDGVLVLDYEAGGNPWDRGVIQYDIPLVDGTTYRVSFDAKGDAAITFAAELYNGTGFGSGDLSLTTDWQTFTFDIVYADGSWSAPKLHILLGGQAEAGTFYLDNVSIKEVDATDDTQTTGNEMVTNGMFDDMTPFGAWFGDQWSGYTTASASVVNGELVVTIDGLTVDHASYAVQVFQEGFTIQQGVTYKVEFDAYADVARKMAINLGDAIDADPYFTEFVDTQIVNLTTEKQHFVFEFTMTLETNEEGKLVFELGTIDGEFINTVVYLDNIVVYPVY